MIKKVVTALYVHISNIDELKEKLSESEFQRIMNIISDFDKDFTIVKYDKGNISLIESKDWDISNEPLVGNSYCFKPNGEIKITKSKGQIYHNKWQFVANDYKGFDIEKAKQRTIEWNSIPNIRNLKSKIGYQKFWFNLLDEYKIKH